MSIHDPQYVVVISGQYPSHFTSNGDIVFSLTRIWNDDSLFSFLSTSQTFEEMTLEMYASIQSCPIDHDPTDIEFDISEPNLSIHPFGGAVQQQLITNHAAGPSNACSEPPHLQSEDMHMLNEFGGNIIQLTQETIICDDELHEAAVCQSCDDELHEVTVCQPSDDDSLDDNATTENDEPDNVHIAPIGTSNARSSWSMPIPYLDNTPEDADDVKIINSNSAPLWNEKNPEHIQQGMFFMNKNQMKSAVRLYNITKGMEFKSDQSKGEYWKVVCKKQATGCEWMIRFCHIGGDVWKAGKMINHTCNADEYKEDHRNMTSNMIATSLVPFVIQDPNIAIKMVQEIIKELHNYTPSYRKAQKGRRKAFIKLYGEFENSFKELPSYMATLQYCSRGTIVEWDFHSTTMQGEQIFKYMFWTFKACIDSFKSCRPVISIDGTHLYGKYDIKLLIAVAIDANRNVLPLAYAIVARESFESWSWFLTLLWRHVVGDRTEIGLISDRHQGILKCVQIFYWLQPPLTHHRFCVRHLKANFNKKNLNNHLQMLMWCAANEHQEKKFVQKMEHIKTINPEAYRWLIDIPLEKWTMYRDGGFRWGSLTTNVSESYNGMLKKARGLPVTAMVRMTVKSLIDRFVQRNNLADALLAQKMPWPLFVQKKFNDYWKRAHVHTDLMNYSTTTAVFEILTLARNGKGGNVQTKFLDAKIYSCRKWVNYHMPCSHAIKACGVRGIEPKTFVSKYYSTKYYKQTYSGSFTPVGDQGCWPPASFSLVANTEYLRTTGQQSKLRRKNEMDIALARMSRKCSVCKQTRHTKARCSSRNAL